MGFNAMEIGGLVVIAVAAIMQISAVATLKWQTYESTVFGFSIDAGLFRVCSSSGALASCQSIDVKNKQAEYNIVKATAILSILVMLGLIAAILVYKLAWKKRTLIPTIVMGIIAVILGMITVIVYAASLRVSGSLLEFGASFYVSCVAVVLYLVGVIIHGIGTKNSE